MKDYVLKSIKFYVIPLFKVLERMLGSAAGGKNRSQLSAIPAVM